MDVVRSAFRPHKRVAAEIFGKSRTRQEFADECDINSIMRRYEKTGTVSHIAPRAPRYLDLADAPDFMSAMNLLIEASAAFMTLPARVRKEFDNDPARFVEFVEKPENLDQVRAWGLAKPVEAESPPMKVEVVSTAAAPLAPSGAA